MGPEFCEYISKFPTLSAQLMVIKEHAPQVLKAISSRVKTYEDLKENLEELEVLITYSAKNAFELQGQEINIDEFIECAYRDSNDLKLINVKYGKNYNERLEEKFNDEYEKAKNLYFKEWIIERKLDVYMNKVYSLSVDRAKVLIKDYASDLENLKNISVGTRQFFEKLNEVIKLNDEDEIDRLFNTENVKYTPTKIQEMKKEISRECAKEFATEFEKTNQEIQQKLQEENNEDVSEIEYNGKKIKQVKLNGKFNALFHSTDTGFIRTKDKVDDFKEDWKKGQDKNNHVISTVYANQEFVGMPPVKENGVRYVFVSVQPKDIKLMGVTDLNTYSRNFAYDSVEKQYMSANTLPYSCRRVYDEFGIERGETIPDYIAIFDDDLPEVIENSYKAAIQFGIPILNMDKSEIEQAQIQGLEKLLEQFKETNDSDILQRLLNKYETNMAGWLLNRSEEEDTSFTSSINNERFRKDFEDIYVKIENAIKQFLTFENKSEHSNKQIYETIRILLHEIELYKESEEEKPISKTRISYDAKGLLRTANEALETTGIDELKVDLENLPTSKEYEIKIQEFVKKALGQENPLTIKDFTEAKDFLHSRKLHFLERKK